MSSRAPNHACPHAAPTALAATLDALHISQSGARRHRCVACAYRHGFEAGHAAACRDRRTRTWQDAEPRELCEEGRAAPLAVIEALDENQGEHRHRCAVCAWSLGWRDGVAAAG